MSNHEWLTMKQASEVSEVSKDTVWRAVRRGEIPATLQMGPAGKQYVLKRADVELWRRNRLGDLATPATPAAPQDPAPATPEAAPGAAPAMPAAADAAAAAHGTMPDATLRTGSAPQVSDSSESVAAPAVGAVPVDLHRQALELVAAEREERIRLMDELRRVEISAERRLVGLQAELMAHRRALADNAESIVEREARARQAEAAAEEARRRAEELEADAERAVAERRLREKLESDVAALTDRALEAEGRAAQERRKWERIPSWVRRLLGAS